MKKPKAIQFPINNICNSRCQMCDIWQQRKGNEIAPLDLRRILADPLFSEVMSVGMNGGEPTLRLDLADLAQELINGLPKLRGISLITNGLRPHLVIPRVEELFSVTQKGGVRLGIMLSLDGVDDVHDRVRGRKGNFDAVVECLDYFRSNKIGDSYRLGCTLISENIEEAERLMLWAEENNIYCRFRLGISHQRLYTKHKPEPFDLNEKQRFHLCNFLDTLVARYERNNLARILFLRNLRNQIAYSSPRANGCAWQSEGVTLLSDGGLAYCAVESPTLGNLIDGQKSASNLYYSNASILADIVSNKCQGCLHDYEGKNPRIKDRAIAKTKQLAARHRVPVLPLKVLSTTRRLVKNVFKVYGLPSFSEVRYVPSSNGQRKILIVGWYGTETLGDKGILYSIIDSLIHAGVCAERLVIASIEPYITRYTLHELYSSLPIEVVSLSSAEVCAKAGDYGQVVFGGGPIMSSISYLCDIASIFNAVKMRGGQALVWGCGLGPIRRRKSDYVNRLAIKQILSKADYCVFRDQQSLSTAAEILPSLNGETCSVALDPAFHWVQRVALGLPACNSAATQDSQLIGFAIRSLPISEYYSNSEADATQLKTSFDGLISGLVEKHHRESGVYLQCMHRLPCGGDDRLFYADLLGGRADEYGLTFQHTNPMEDIQQIASLKLIYAMRFHSVVFALALGVPVVAIDYTNGGKVSSLCEAFGIDCWSPSDLIRYVQEQGCAPKPQLPNRNLLKSIVKDSVVVYSDLARNVAHFAAV